MKKHELLLKYLDEKICTLREGNQDAYDEWIRQIENKNCEHYHYTRGTYMGYDNAMRIISELLDDLAEGKHEH